MGTLFGGWGSPAVLSDGLHGIQLTDYDKVSNAETPFAVRAWPCVVPLRGGVGLLNIMYLIIDCFKTAS